MRPHNVLPLGLLFIATMLWSSSRQACPTHLQAYDSMAEQLAHAHGGAARAGRQCSCPPPGERPAPTEHPPAGEEAGPAAGEEVGEEAGKGAGVSEEQPSEARRAEAQRAEEAYAVCRRHGWLDPFDQFLKE